jgi:hypothetical protein
LDPDWIWIQAGKTNPQAKKGEELSYFKFLDVLFKELEASSVAWKFLRGRLVTEFFLFFLFFIFYFPRAS